MCLASLWAILPFCSVKYEKHSGKGLGKVGSLAYQFTTFEFTEPGTGTLLYPGCEPSLGAWIDKKAEEEGKKRRVKERKEIWHNSHTPSQLFSFFLSCPLRNPPHLKQYSVRSSRSTWPGQKTFVSYYTILYSTNCRWKLIATEKFMSTQWLIKKWLPARSSYTVPLSPLLSVSAVSPGCTNFVMPLKAETPPTGHTSNGLSYDNDECLYN